MVFHWILSDSKSPRVSRTLLSIQADLHNAIVWIVSIRPPISNTCSRLSKPLGAVPRAPITIGFTITFIYPVGWGCRIHRLHLCREVRFPLPNECPGYDTKQPDGEVPVMLEFWGTLSTPSLSLLPGPLRPGEVASDRVQIERKCLHMLN